MKKSNIIFGAGLILILGLCGCTNGKNASNVENTDAAALLTEVKTTQYFTDDKVSDEDTKKILSAGRNAPSAMNTQPWHFTAVTDEEVTKELADAVSSMKPPAAKNGEMPDPQKQKTGENQKDIPEKPPVSDRDKPDFSKAANKAGIGSAPLTIVISCEEGAELSAGLAVQNMSAEAQILGYGTKILTSPTIALNGEKQSEYKALLNIPDNQKVAAVLLVGKASSGEENPDVLSSATTRNSFEDMVTVIGD